MPPKRKAKGKKRARARCPSPSPSPLDVVIGSDIRVGLYPSSGESLQYEWTRGGGALMEEVIRDLGGSNVWAEHSPEAAEYISDEIDLFR